MPPNLSSGPGHRHPFFAGSTTLGHAAGPTPAAAATEMNPFGAHLAVVAGRRMARPLWRRRRPRAHRSRRPRPAAPKSCRAGAC